MEFLNIIKSFWKYIKHRKWHTKLNSKTKKNSKTIKKCVTLVSYFQKLEKIRTIQNVIKNYKKSGEL